MFWLIHTLHSFSCAVSCLIPCMHIKGDLQTHKIAPNVGVGNDRKTSEDIARCTNRHCNFHICAKLQKSYCAKTQPENEIPSLLVHLFTGMLQQKLTHGKLPNFFGFQNHFSLCLNPLKPQDNLMNTTNCRPESHCLLHHPDICLNFTMLEMTIYKFLSLIPHAVRW